MPREHYGPKAKEQTRVLLEALLAYVNYELENCDRLEIKFDWKTYKELVVETNLRYLEELIAQAQPNGKLKNYTGTKPQKRLISNSP